MARIKGAKNKSTILMEKMIAQGMDPKEAKVKAKMQIAREARGTKKTSKKKVAKKSTSKPKKKIPATGGKSEKVLSSHMGTLTENAYNKAMAGNSRKNAIRAFCLMCMGGSTSDVRDCTSESCPLFQFRLKG